MKKIYLLFFLINSFLIHAQLVTIPDSNFKNALTSTNCVDTNGDGNYDADADLNDDGEIQVSEAEAILSLNVSFQNIVSVEGLANFINLTTLYCTDNPLAELDVSALINLEVIGCWDIDEVVTLDFSSNPNLTSIECDSNDSLEFLNIQNGANENLVLMLADNLNNLQCIQVDDVAYAESQICGGEPISWCKENFTSYSENCILGIADFEIVKIALYPNPAKDEITLESNSIIDKIELYNAFGSLISNKKLQNNTIDLSSLNSGIYFVKIETKNRTETRKIIKE